MRASRSSCSAHAEDFMRASRAHLRSQALHSGHTEGKPECLLNLRGKKTNQANVSLTRFHFDNSRGGESLVKNMTKEYRYFTIVDGLSGKRLSLCLKISGSLTG